MRADDGRRRRRSRSASVVPRDASRADFDSLSDRIDVLIDAHEQTQERTVEVRKRIGRLGRIQEDSQDLQNRMQSTIAED